MKTEEELKFLLFATIRLAEAGKLAKDAATKGFCQALGYCLGMPDTVSPIILDLFKDEAWSQEGVDFEIAKIRISAQKAYEEHEKEMELNKRMKKFFQQSWEKFLEQLPPVDEKQTEE